ncbi:MAG: transposase [Rhodanobacteraceae bacterium]|nr:transposase [Rhodanobacteraceae bacterium]
MNVAGARVALIGVGPITADAVVASALALREFSSGRQLAAWLGWCPPSTCSGLLSTQKPAYQLPQRYSYLRTLLIQGARGSLQRPRSSAGKGDRFEQI